MSYCGSGDFDTKYGTITARYPGRKEAPPNLQTLKRNKGKPALPGYVYSADAGDVLMQGPALRAFRQAELRATPLRLRKKGKIQPILLTGVGYRSYLTQKALYEGPDNTNGTRFANPDCSLHCEALADDLKWTALLLLRNAKVRKALEEEGFHFAIPGEPWHASFRLAG
jgi:hypothetical protein